MYIFFNCMVKPYIRRVSCCRVDQRGIYRQIANPLLVEDGGIEGRTVVVDRQMGKLVDLDGCGWYLISEKCLFHGGDSVESSKDWWKVIG